MPNTSEFDTIFTALSALQIIQHESDIIDVTALSGGVSSDIWKVDIVGTPKNVVVKRALPKLRVTAEWHAPVERISTEADWLELAANVNPAFAPRVFGRNEANHTLVLEYLPEKSYPVWKSNLASGIVDTSFAGAVGHALALIHTSTAANEEVERKFAHTRQFGALRLEPFFLYTAGRNPVVSDILKNLAQRIAESRIALMQGDISPKNILCGPNGPVFLDAETACYGDPAFDLAFCLNHLLLKCIWKPLHTAQYLASFKSLSKSYLSGVNWEDRRAIEDRVVAMLPAFSLARVDGKSPADYIKSDKDKSFVRQTAKAFMLQPCATLAELGEAWCNALPNGNS